MNFVVPRPYLFLSALGLALIIAILVGCTAPSAGTAAASPASASAQVSSESAAVWLPDWAGDVPDAVANRRALPFCGLEKAPTPVPGEVIDRAVRLCFWNAHLAGAEAEFASVQSTVEGDPIATIYRLATDGTVEVLTDSSQDRFGAGGWQTTRCSDVVEGEGGSLLGVSDCGDAATLE